MPDKRFPAACCVAVLTLIPMVATEVFAHGPGMDRAPEINFEDRDVTVTAKMTPSDMTWGISQTRLWR